jgi:DNA-binding NarL/FixJ family response regulator
MTIRVVVADDQELVRGGFVMILEAQPDIVVVAEAADGRAAVEAARRHVPDVVLLDIRMPELDGIEAARLVCAETPCRVIMLTTFDLDEYMFDALDAGASGFLLKDVRREDLVHAVRVVTRGDALLAPSATRRLIAQYVGRGAAEAPPRVSRDAKYVGRGAAEAPPRRSRDSTSTVGASPLTSREQEILGLLARGLSNAEMADTLVVSEHTVKTHVSNVLAKLGLRDRIHAVIHAYESGLVTPSDPHPRAR